jgi:tetratricopeptide (TPR) repeat protein
MKDFFISYNKADRSWAEWIAWQLEEEGYTTVIQAWDFRPGSNFMLDMQQAASEAERTIAVLSPDYLASAFTQPEWAAAFVQDPTGEKSILLPVRVRETDTKGLLRPIVYIDLVGLDEATAKARLLAGLPGAPRKPTTAPNYPGTPKHAVPNRPRFPGALPGTWNVPHQRNPNFTGREKLLTDIRTALTSGQHAALTQAISGLGGVGKTQLAVEYAYRYATEYDIVWWVRSEEPSTLAAEYVALAAELGLPEQNAREQATIAQAVRHWLGHNSGWMLIFDNANNQKDMHDYLPQGATGHVIITSRDHNWRGVATTLSVRVLAQDESVDFLLKRTGQTDREAAARLAEELGNLPLALEQAGAYMEETGRSLSAYLQLFQTRKGEILKRGTLSTDYPATIATTWELSFQKVQEASPAGADLLNLCAFLAPDDIPQEILREGGEHLPESLATAVADPLAFDDAVAALRHYSLVEVDIDKDALSVHRLVQAVVRDRLGEDERKLWAEVAMRLAYEGFPFDTNDMNTWKAATRILPHVLAVTGHVEELGVASEIAGSLLNNVGVYLTEFAQYTQAKGVFERAVILGEAAYNPDHANVDAYVNNLGLVLRKLGNLAEAREHYERALAISEAAYGPDHPNVAIYANNLGSVLWASQDLVEAQKHYERALAIDEATYGPDHPNVANRVNNLGTVLQDLGDLAGAREHYERALAIDEAAYGPDHPNVAISVNNLGQVLRKLGDLAQAQAYFERAIAIGEAAYGPNHPQVAIYINNLGDALQDLGNPQGARAHYERALTIDETAYGPDHNTVAIYANNLGNVLRELGDLAGARAYFERALTIDETAYGPNHPTIAIRVGNLGIILLELGDLRGARIHLDRAFRIFYKFLGEDHPNTNNTRGWLERIDEEMSRRQHE